MLPTWEQRSIITANLLNPAFCGEILRLATASYEKKNGKPLAFSLAFLILPLVLHKKTRDSLPKTISTKLHDWLSSNDELKIGMAERIKYMVPYTREAILFLLFHEVLSLDNTGRLSYHLLIHFALHWHFVKNNRPIPNFLVIDQPTQVYYPPERENISDLQNFQSADEIAVKQMFDFMFDKVKQLEGKFQVIVTDHAWLRYDLFDEAIVAVWRNGEKLIPASWYE